MQARGVLTQKVNKTEKLNNHYTRKIVIIRNRIFPTSSIYPLDILNQGLFVFQNVTENVQILLRAVVIRSRQSVKTP